MIIKVLPSISCKCLDETCCFKDMLHDANFDYQEAIDLIEGYLNTDVHKVDINDIFSLLNKEFNFENLLSVEEFDLSSIENDVLNVLELFF
mgnify:CR=1 FL=1